MLKLFKGVVVQWLRQRIGEDGLTRVVKVKTKDGEYKRPITKICALPEKHATFSIENDEKERVKANIIGVVTKKRKSIGILPIITAFLTLCVTMSNQPPINKQYTITKFDTSPGIYFEKTHNVYMTHSDWNVLSYLNLQTLHDEFDSLTKNFNTAKEFCFRRVAHSSGCRNIVLHLKKET